MVELKGIASFAGKRIKIFLEGDFVYRGICLSVDDNFLVIDDIRDGEIAVSFKQIREVKVINGEKD